MIFTSREALAGLYPRLLDHAAVNFSAKDILTFLGRKLHPRFEGEVLLPARKIVARSQDQTPHEEQLAEDVRQVRPGLADRDRDQQSQRVSRSAVADRAGRDEMAWCPMNKGVCNLYRYREVALAANERYLEALSVIDNPAPAYRQVETLTEPVVKAGRSYAGFNPASSPDVKLFRAVLDGNHLLRGFRNADIREALYGATDDPVERRRQRAAVGRLLKRLHVRRLIKKCPAVTAGS